MANAQDCTTGLPPEVQHVICTLLPNSDLTSVRLVNKQWSAVAATVLWAHVDIDLIETETRRFDALLDPDACGILRNIKSINITTESAGLNLEIERQATWNLLGLLMALPRDALQVFGCMEFKISHLVLNTLLRSHSQIATLRVCVSGAKTPGGFPDGLPSALYVRDGLKNLRHIQICGSEDSAYEELSTWFPHAPKLKRVVISGDLSDPSVESHVWKLPSVHAPLFSLRVLQLLEMRFSDSTSNLAAALDLSRLAALDVRICFNIAPLLKGLSKALRKTKANSLQLILLDYRGSSENESRASEELFGSVEGLKQVACLPLRGSLPRLNSLHRSAGTLQWLSLYVSGSNRVYSVRDFEQLPVYFINVQTLFLSIGDLSQFIDDLETLEPFDLSIDQEYTKKLDFIARLPKLKKLCITDRPYESDNYTPRRQRQLRYAQVAEQILGYLVERGSNVQFLNFKPSRHPRNAAETDDKDDNGHLWPYYAFKKGTIVTDAHGCRESVKTVVIPVPFEPWIR